MKTTEIPKIIHYCWFGRNPLPEMAIKCIESWRRYLPDYQIKEWNEDNFDIGMVPYIEEAYHCRKFAFVSDFARFWILYNYGGIYFDVDVEVIRPMDDIIAKGPFMGLEQLAGDATYRGCRALPAAGLGFAAYPKFEPLKSILSYYDNRHFISLRGKLEYKTVVLIVTDILLDRGGIIEHDKVSTLMGINLYPEEYFNPKSLQTGKITITDNTRSIHHFAGTWVERRRKRGLAMHWERLQRLLLRTKLSLKRHLTTNKK